MSLDYGGPRGVSLERGPGPIFVAAAGHPSWRLGAPATPPTRRAAAQPTPPAPDPVAFWVNAGISIARTAITDLTRLWNTFIATPPTLPAAPSDIPAISAAASGTATSALGVGQSAYSIAERGPSVQNVGALTVGLGRLWEGGKALLGFGPTAAADVAAGATSAGASGAGTSAGSATSLIGPAAGILGTGLTAYQVATDPSPQAAAGLATSAAYTAGYVASSAGASGIAAGAAIAAPMFAVVSLPFIIGSILTPIFRSIEFMLHPTPSWPEGFIPVPGQEQEYAVDPSSGRVLRFQGGRTGHYEWSELTRSGRPVTPEQFAEWGIQPTGRLVGLPGYADVPKFRDELVQAKLSGASLADVDRHVIRSLLAEQRQPTIDILKRDNPDASEGEIWRQYTLTPEYEQERALGDALAHQVRSDF